MAESCPDVYANWHPFWRLLGQLQGNPRDRRFAEELTIVCDGDKVGLIVTSGSGSAYYYLWIVFTEVIGYPVQYHYVESEDC